MATLISSRHCIRDHAVHNYHWLLASRPTCSHPIVQLAHCRMQRPVRTRLRLFPCDFGDCKGSKLGLLRLQPRQLNAGSSVWLLKTVVKW